MAETLFRWRVHCLTESTQVHTWSETKPTVCPNDSGHTINAADTVKDSARIVDPIVVEAPLESVQSGVTKVIANDRVAIEVASGVTGFAATHLFWPKLKKWDDPALILDFRFILKAAGTGSKVRIATKAKAQSVGEDSASAFSPEGFTAVSVTHTTLGEVFAAEVVLDGSGFEKGDAVALQIGRDGNNEMGAGDSDDVDVSIQIIAMQVGVR